LKKLLNIFHLYVICFFSGLYFIFPDSFFAFL